MTSRAIGAAMALAAALAVTAAACDSTAPAGLGDPTVIRKVAGDGQTASPGATLPTPMVVAARGKLSGAPRVGRVIE